ncbi:MAG: glycosyl transferase family 1 [Gemmatimonadales bacterium]
MSNTSPSACQFHILSFEGPDAYSRAGGIASRLTGLASALADAGCETHFWFVGDPVLPGHEHQGALALHRWCQWISAHHPAGVYDGEERKEPDYASSLPPYLVREVLLPHLENPAHRAVVLAEEWHTVHTVLHLDWLLRRTGIRERVRIVWNANNTFGFDRIDWPRLDAAATLTTVSRYMRFQLRAVGVDPLVIPNGLSQDAFRQPTPGAVREFKALTSDRLVLAKVARWDPGKHWLLAVDTTAELKRAGARPLLVARGGVEAHGVEVRRRAAAAGLDVVERVASEPGERGLLDALADPAGADVVVVGSPLDREATQLLFHASAAVLANSAHEPFGLVGLETMAVQGLACTGATGEDYVLPGWNALLLQTCDPLEFVQQFAGLRQDPSVERALRRNGLTTARGFAWSEVLSRCLFPRLGLGGGPTRSDGVMWRDVPSRRPAGSARTRGARAPTCAGFRPERRADAASAAACGVAFVPAAASAVARRAPARGMGS